MRKQGLFIHADHLHISRHRLEYYEQACAVDADTSRCAGSSAECRQAVTGILGTQLRVMCSCAGSTAREAYFCVDWQRILWFNPCVGEFVMMFTFSFQSIKTLEIQLDTIYTNIRANGITPPIKQQINPLQ